MSVLRLPAVVLLASSLSGPFAQTPIDALPEHTWALPWPGSGSVTRMVAGEFTGDHRIHAVVLDSGSLWAIYSVAFTDQIVPLAGAANDIATVRGVGGPRQDRLAYVGAAGLGFLGVDCGVQSAPVVEGAWVGARRVLAAGDVENGVLVGIAAASNVMLAASIVGGNYVGTVSRTFAQPIDDYVLADWTGDQIDEVVVLVNDRLVVLNLAFGELLDVPAGETDGAMLATLPVMTTAERVAHVRRNAASEWELVVWGNGTSTAPKLLGFTPGGMAGGDFDGDRRPDLCLTVAGANQVKVLLQRLVTSVPFLPGSETMVRSFQMDGALSLSGAPLFVDIDRDDLCDIVATASTITGPQLTARSGNSVAPPDGTDGHLVFGDLVATEAATPAGTIPVLELELNPDHYDEAAYNTAEVVLWRYEGGTGLQLLGNRTRFDLSAVQAGQHAWLVVPLPSTFPVWGDWNGKQVWMEVRVAKRAPNTPVTGTLTTVGPTWLLAVTAGGGLPQGDGTTTTLWNGTGSPPASVASLASFASAIHGVRIPGATFYRGRQMFGGAVRPKKLRAYANSSAPNPGTIGAGTTYSRDA